MGLFLLAGARRTGTTLLNSVLCSDSTANPLVGEAQLLTRLVETYRWGKDHFTLFQKYYFDNLKDYRTFYSRLVGSFIEHARRRFAPATNLILKNPEFSLVFHDLTELVPEAKVIVSVRDPRDQVVSELETGMRQIRQGKCNRVVAQRNIAALARNYNKYYEPIVEGAAGMVGKLLLVRFEDLLLRTEDVLQRLRDFTGMGLSLFRPESNWARVELDWNEYRDVPAVTQFYNGPLAPDRVGRYVQVLSRGEVQIVNSICGPLMDRFGYRGEGQSPTYPPDPLCWIPANKAS